jgi:hypothetical protein
MYHGFENDSMISFSFPKRVYKLQGSQDILISSRFMVSGSFDFGAL